MTTKIAETRTKLASDPTAGWVRPEVTAVLANGRARLSGGAFNWEADLPDSLGGGNQAPGPTPYLLGALAGCAVAFINDTLAPEFGVTIDSLTATARCSSDLGGLVGVEGARPELQGLGLTVTIESPSPVDRVTALQQAWQERCPIYLALLHPNRVALTFC